MVQITLTPQASALVINEPDNVFSRVADIVDHINQRPRVLALLQALKNQHKRGMNQQKSPPGRT